MTNIEQLKVVADLQQVWQQALLDTRPTADADDVLDRLERKYQDIADEADSKT